MTPEAPRWDPVPTLKRLICKIGWGQVVLRRVFWWCYQKTSRVGFPSKTLCRILFHSKSDIVASGNFQGRERRLSAPLLAPPVPGRTWARISIAQAKKSKRKRAPAAEMQWLDVSCKTPITTIDPMRLLSMSINLSTFERL